MKKRFATTLDIASAINDVFGRARSFKMTHTAVLDALQPIREELNSRTPKGARRYSEYEAAWCAGYIHARSDDMWHGGALEFCYRDSAGILYSTSKDSAHRKTEEFYAAGRGAELGHMECAHVWRGTDKPYSPWGRLDRTKPAEVPSA